MRKNIIKKTLISLGILSSFSVLMLSATASTLTLTTSGYDEGIKGNISLSGETVINSVKYQAVGSASWTTLDSDLIREESDSYRFDILGLEAGKYNVKVNGTFDGVEFNEESNNITVTSDDRSGYAHFNYTDGVGAYNDDGTLKDNAVVVYVTDSNKNTVEANIGGTTYTGLSSILSNASSAYPLDIRIIGSVKTTQWNEISYNSTKQTYSLIKEQAASLGGNFNTFTAEEILENGWNSYSNDLAEGITTLEGLESKVSYSSNGVHCATTDTTSEEYYSMAFDTSWNMMKVSSKSNITVEGVGDDASIFQWGFTFSNCNSIEVKNLTFNNYTEDAIGIEGGKSTYTNYSNFWLHNNTFNLGVNNWDFSDEKDKGDGDGATDFKYAHNLTISYCRYNNTHKTNLIGGGDSHLQYNITLHHNYYNQCASRLPLGRQANMHFYNNYYYDCSTCQDIRANAFVLSESNYFYSCSNPQKVTTSGYTGTTIKSYNDYLEECGTSQATVVNSRDQQVEGGNCKPDGKTDYSNFDTNDSLFYYDSTNNVSDVERLDDVSELPTIIPSIAGAGITESKNPSSETSNYTLQVSGNTGSYTENETTYYAYRAIGKLTGATEEEISNATINATVTGTSKSGNTYTYPYEITTVYKQLTSNGDVLSGCEAADNTWYFYLIIKDITSSYNGYSFTISFDITIGDETLNKTVEEYVINISDSTTSYMITFDSVEDSSIAAGQSKVYDNFTVNGDVSFNTCDVTINGNNFTKYVSTPGASKESTSRNIMFNVSSSATIRVYYYTKSSGRKVGLWNSEYTQIGTYSSLDEETSYVDFSVTDSGNYYVGSAGSGIYIYAIEIIYN